MEDPTLEQVDVPEGGCDTMGSPCWSRILAWPVDPWGEEPTLEQVCWQDLWFCVGFMLEQSVPEGLHPTEGTYDGADCEQLQPVGSTHTKEVHVGLFPIDGTLCWSRAKAWVLLPLRTKEWQREHVMNRPQPPFPVLLHHLGGGSGENEE